MQHFQAIQARLDNELYRLERAKKQREIVWREHNIKAIRRELFQEYEFLQPLGNMAEMTEDELLLELMS